MNPVCLGRSGAIKHGLLFWICTFLFRHCFDAGQMVCISYMLHFCDSAQELLEQWAAEKIHLSGDEDSCEETWTKKTEAEIRREWDHLLDPDEEQYELEDVQDQTSRTPANKGM